MARPAPAFRLGINFPWVACGHDFGPHPAPWAGAPRTPWATVRDELASLRALGLRVVRWWVLAGGVNFPPEHGMRDHGRRVAVAPPYARLARRMGLAVPERFEITAPAPPLPAAALEDFERLLEIVASLDLTLWPSLLSFEWFLPIRDEPDGVTSGGRAGFALPPHRRGFLDATLEPLLRVADRWPRAVEAFEVMNEPIWAVRPPAAGRLGHRRPMICPAALEAFLMDATERVAAHGHRATIGFVGARPSFMRTSSLAALAAMAARGRYVHQVHHYPRRTRNDPLPPARESPIHPCWVGEVGTSRHARWSDPGLAEDDPTRFLERRIARVRESGYRGAMLWAARAEDPHVTWDETTRAQIHRAARALER